MELKSTACCVLRFALQVTAGDERMSGRSRPPQLLRFELRRRVGRHTAEVQQAQNASQNCFLSFRSIFVNFKLINVIFSYLFGICICICKYGYKRKEKKKKREETKKK